MSDKQQQQQDSAKVEVLLVSDVHNKLDRVRQLAACAGPCDVVLCAGDLACRPVSSGHADDPDVVAQAEADTAAAVAALKAMSAAAPLFFVPGNHDAPSTYRAAAPQAEEAKTPQQTTANAHGRKVRVEVGSRAALLLVGLGGSTPVTYRDAPHPWSAYPYGSDADLRGALDEVLKAKTEGGDEEGVLRVLLTHQGPSLSSTTIDCVYDPENPIYSGSAAITQAIRGCGAAGAPFVLAVHGHTHNARGATVLPHGTVVVNPGALEEGHYARCTLVRRGTAWEVGAVQLLSLPPLPEC